MLWSWNARCGGAEIESVELCTEERRGGGEIPKVGWPKLESLESDWEEGIIENRET